MMGVLKKLLGALYKPNIIEVDKIHNENLVNEIKRLILMDGLDELMQSKTAPLYMINVHRESFIELANGILVKNDKTTITAVSLGHYFKGLDDRINYTLTRMIPILESNKISYQVESDLIEVTLILKRLMGGR